MADTPKGETVSPTDKAARIRPSDATPSGATPSGAISAAPDSPAPADVIAGGTGGDSLATGPGENDRAVGGRGPTRPARPADNPPPARRGGARGFVILVILLLLAAGGAYATWPMWRDHVAPYAEQLGIELPGRQVAEAPAEISPGASPTTPAPTAPAPPTAPAAPSPASPSPPAPTTPSSEATPTEPSATSGEVERLADRLQALEQRVADIEGRPAPEPESAPGPAPDAAAAPSDDLREQVDMLSEKLTAVTDEVAIVREGLAGSAGGEGLGPLAAQLSDRLQDLTDRLAAVEERSATMPGIAERVGALEQRPETPAATPERVEAVQVRVDTLSGRLDDEVRKSAEAVVRLEGRLTAIDGRLEQITQALEATRGSREVAGAFLLAANQLAAATARSGGFEPELAALRETAPDDQAVAAALEALAPHAGGVPSLAVLRDRFASTATAAVDASLVGSSEGILGQALTRVASLVTIRRTADDAGDGLDAVLVRAESALAAGDLAAAVEAVRGLDGDPAAAAAGWLADAEARLAVDGAVRAVQAASLAGVAGG